MITYKKLTDLASVQGITIEELAQSISMSRQGLNRAVTNGTLPARKIEKLCEKMGLSPNQLFGIEPIATVANLLIGDGNTGISQSVTTTSVRELEKENEYLKERLSDKDALIETQKQLIASLKQNKSNTTATPKQQSAC